MKKSKANYDGHSDAETMRKGFGDWMYENVSHFSSNDLGERVQLTYMPVDDIRDPKLDTDAMSQISREEIQARLEAHEARVDSRVTAFDATMRDGISQIRHEMADLRGDIRVVQTELAPLKGLKGTIVNTAIGSVLAIAALVGGVMAYGIASFDSGRETTALISEAKQQAAENRKLLEQIESKLKAIPAQSSVLEGASKSELAPGK